MLGFLRTGAAWVAAISLVLPAPLSAAPAGVSQLVMDADSGEVLRSRNAERVRAPASLTKMMTLLLAFEAIERGRLKPRERIVMTARAARQQPSRLGIRRGGTLTLDAALRSIAVISANDVAVAVAERVAGSETAFVTKMNVKARAIGLRSTRFGNATGLSPNGGRTTARDMALLSRYLIRNYPSRYKLFRTRSIRWGGATRPNHNKLLGRVEGLDGIKTGYTVEAGFNLAASARRGGRRMIVVVMGSPSASERDVTVANLIEVGFSSFKAAASKPKRARRARR